MANPASGDHEDSKKVKCIMFSKFCRDLNGCRFMSVGIIMVMMVCSYNTAYSQIWGDVESGVVNTGYNNVRIPGNSGTRFSLKDDLTPDPEIFVRLRVGYAVHSRHHISLLYAPLRVVSNGNFSEDIRFQDVLFPAGQPVEAVYRFNSYRVTYRYDLVDHPKFRFGLGITAKIRDADISLATDGLFAHKPDLGFVPIINFHLHWQRWERLGILLEGDALAAPQGRAEDVLLAATFALSDNLIFRGGYRILEGGADNRVVYTFSMFHYASLGMTYRIKPSVK
jgi:hypothetical protein